MGYGIYSQQDDVCYISKGCFQCPRYNIGKLGSKGTHLSPLWLAFYLHSVGATLIDEDILDMKTIIYRDFFMGYDVVRDINRKPKLI